MTGADDDFSCGLHRLVQARSGDKGDACDISVFAPSDLIYAALLSELTPERVRAHFGTFVHGAVERYELPKLRALKFVLHDALGGGGSASLRSDNLGKSMSANLLRMSIRIPRQVAEASPIFQGPGAVT